MSGLSPIQRERLLLQTLIFIFAFVPIMAGFQGILNASAMLLVISGDVALDSHIRYLSGLLLAIGLTFWSAIPNIEHKSGRIRLLVCLVVVGGLARLFSLFVDGWPGPAMGGALVMELIVTPALYLWHRRIALRLASH